MKSRPILFSSDMVRAILAGTKTQTRRVIKGTTGAFWDHRAYKPILDVYQSGIQAWIDPEGRIFSETAPTPLCPFGQPGDFLWVRETWAALHPHTDAPVDHKTAGVHTLAYAATELIRQKEYGGTVFRGPWKPSIHMPHSFSRITLEITAVRMERLNEISEADAEREGCAPAWLDVAGEKVHHGSSPTYRQGFARLWNQINGPGSWEVNLWCWVVEFKRVEP